MKPGAYLRRSNLFGAMPLYAPEPGETAISFFVSLFLNP